MSQATELKAAREQLAVEHRFFEGAITAGRLGTDHEDRLAEAAEKVARLSWSTLSFEEKVRTLTALKSLNTGHWWWLIFAPSYRVGS